MPSAPGHAGKPDLILAVQDLTQPPAVCLEPPYCWHQHPGRLDALGLLVLFFFFPRQGFSSQALLQTICLPSKGNNQSFQRRSTAVCLGIYLHRCSAWSHFSPSDVPAEMGPPIPREAFFHGCPCGVGDSFCFLKDSAACLETFQKGSPQLISFQISPVRASGVFVSDNFELLCTLWCRGGCFSLGSILFHHFP